jgi:hypothetical protein
MHTPDTPPWRCTGWVQELRPRMFGPTLTQVEAEILVTLYVPDLTAGQPRLPSAMP